MDHPHHRSTAARIRRQPIRDEFEPLVTPEEAAIYLRVHPKTVIRFARLDQIPALRVGKHWRFRASDLKDWAQFRVKSSRQPVE
jgi:excisionase family DNA binding protein